MSKTERMFKIVLFVTFFTGNLYAQSAAGILDALQIKIQTTSDFYSSYVWRGFILDADPVFQPGISLSRSGFTFNFWSSWDTDNGDSLNSNEIDYLVDYTKEIGQIAISLGHTYYDFPGANTFSKEFYLGIGLPKTFLTPKITYYYDYGTHRQGGGHGQYVALKLAKSLPVFSDPAVTFDLGFQAGYNSQLFIDGHGQNILLSCGFTIPLSKNITLVPNINYSMPFSRLKDSSDGNQKNRFFGGFSVVCTL